MLLNGPAARLGIKGDMVVILAYCAVDGRRSPQVQAEDRPRGRAEPRGVSVGGADICLLLPSWTDKNVRPPPCYTFCDGTDVSTVGNRRSAGPAGRFAAGARRQRDRRHAHLPPDHASRQPVGHSVHPFRDSWILAAGLLGVVAVTAVGHFCDPSTRRKKGQVLTRRTSALRPTWPCC